MRSVLLSLLGCVFASNVALAQFAPAQLQAGAVPAAPVAAVAAGEVFLEVSVDPAGRVAGVKVLRATPPFTELLVTAVRDWRFSPAQDDAPIDPTQPAVPRKRLTVASNVFVAAMYRAPTINTPTLGEPPKDLAVPSDGTAFPVTIAPAQYPPRALFDGVVLTEARLGVDGRVLNTKVVSPAGGFDDAAIAALTAWTFRPALVGGHPVPSRAYVIFGFRQPVTVN